MKNKIVLTVCIVASIVLALLYPTVKNVSLYQQPVTLSVDTGNEKPIIAQDKSYMSSSPIEITKIYLKDQLLGVLSNKEVLDKALEDAYVNTYKENFPGTSIGLGEDVYVVKEQSYYNYEDIDDKIIDYLNEYDLFSVVATRIEFSNGAVIYVKNVDMFVSARDRYIVNFVPSNIYTMLKDNQKPEQLNTFGEQAMSVRILEEISVSQGLASKSRIMETEDEIVEFLGYGYSTEKEYYTVKPNDTVEGVASQAVTGINTEQLISINPGMDIKNSTAILSPGEKLNITYFNSPINIEVKRERLAEEKIYPEPVRYIVDPSLDVGRRIVEANEVIGVRHVRYIDTYVNGILISGEEVSSVTTIQPSQEVVRIGTKGGGEYDHWLDGSGSGMFWLPVKNAKLICAFGCYYNHRGADLIDRYDRWGRAYASDSGIVIRSEYRSDYGYHIFIDHQNGYYTGYAHFSEQSPLKVGDRVTKGQMIGKIGSSGRSTGPHVHWEIWRGSPFGGGERLDPCRIVYCPM